MNCTAFFCAEVGSKCSSSLPPPDMDLPAERDAWHRVNSRRVLVLSERCEWERVTSTGCFSNDSFPGYKQMQKTHGFGENEQMVGFPVSLQVYT